MNGFHNSPRVIRTGHFEIIKGGICDEGMCLRSDICSYFTTHITSQTTLQHFLINYKAKQNKNVTESLHFVGRLHSTSNNITYGEIQNHKICS